MDETYLSYDGLIVGEPGENVPPPTSSLDQDRYSAQVFMQAKMGGEWLYLPHASNEYRQWACQPHRMRCEHITEYCSEKSTVFMPTGSIWIGFCQNCFAKWEHDAEMRGDALPVIARVKDFD